MDRELVVIIVLGLLILLSIFQTFQLTSIRAKVIEPGTPTGVVTQIPTGRAAQSSGPRRMVGGC